MLKEKKIEVINASKIIGIKETFFLDFPTVKLDSVGQKNLNDSIQKIVEIVNPELVYLPHNGDLNKDHRLVFESALVAVRPFSGVKKVLCYETLSETEWGLPTYPFIPNTYVDISETIETKIRAMKTYKSELKEFPHPRSLQCIEILARKRGSEAGMNFAEAFMLVRELLF